MKYFLNLDLIGLVPFTVAHGEGFGAKGNDMKVRFSCVGSGFEKFNELKNSLRGALGGVTEKETTATIYDSNDDIVTRISKIKQADSKQVALTDKIKQGALPLVLTGYEKNSVKNLAARKARVDEYAEEEEEAQVQSGLATKIEQKLMEYKDLDPKKDLTYLDKEKKSAWQEGKRMHLGNDKEKFVQPYIDLVDSLDAIKQHKASDDGKSFIEVLNDPLNNDDEKLQTSLTENGFDLSLKEAYESALTEVQKLGLHKISGHAIHH